jgi:hypothetical protein
VKRRGFLKSILAAGCAPFVVTTAGVLMPVRDLWKPSFAWLWLITRNEFGLEQRIATDLDKAVWFSGLNVIERVEAHVPGIGLVEVKTKDRGDWETMRHSMLDGWFTVTSPPQNYIRINEHHLIPNPRHRDHGGFPETHSSHYT